MRIEESYHERKIPYGDERHHGNISMERAEQIDTVALVEISREGRKAIELRNRDEFANEIKEYDKSLNHMPEYSGIYDVDKTIAKAVENCSKEEQAFVYDIIRQNFLLNDCESMTEEERQANISLGMKKAEYAAEHFISEDERDAFIDAMETIAKMASVGRSDSNGTIDYGISRGKYLGHGSNLVKVTDTIGIMKSTEPDVYAEYTRLKAENPNESLRYLMNWYEGAISKDKNLVQNYEKQSDDYVDEKIKNQKLDETFNGLNTESKAAFLESLRAFQVSNPGFLSFFINRELLSNFWKV